MRVGFNNGLIFPMNCRQKWITDKTVGRWFSLSRDVVARAKQSRVLWRYRILSEISAFCESAWLVIVFALWHPPSCLQHMFRINSLYSQIIAHQSRFNHLINDEYSAQFSIIVVCWWFLISRTIYPLVTRLMIG